MSSQCEPAPTDRDLEIVSNILGIMREEGELGVEGDSLYEEGYELEKLQKVLQNLEESPENRVKTSEKGCLLQPLAPDGGCFQFSSEPSWKLSAAEVGESSRSTTPELLLSLLQEEGADKGTEALRREVEELRWALAGEKKRTVYLCMENQRLHSLLAQMQSNMSSLHCALPFGAETDPGHSLCPNWYGGEEEGGFVEGSLNPSSSGNIGMNPMSEQGEDHGPSLLPTASLSISAPPFQPSSRCLSSHLKPWEAQGEEGVEGGGGEGECVAPSFFRSSSLLFPAPGEGGGEVEGHGGSKIFIPADRRMWTSTLGNIPMHRKQLF